MNSRMINRILLASAALMALFVCYVVVDSHSCDFTMRFPASSSVATCDSGVYYTKTRLEQGDERYKINTQALYIKVFDRVLLVPLEKDIDVEVKGSLAVYDAEKIKTPQRTFGNQPYSSLSVLRDDEGNMIGVAVFSDPNSILVPATAITGTL
jgi:hypothetical protein